MVKLIKINELPLKPYMVILLKKEVFENVCSAVANL